MVRVVSCLAALLLVTHSLRPAAAVWPSSATSSSSSSSSFLKKLLSFALQNSPLASVMELVPSLDPNGGAGGGFGGGGFGGGFNGGGIFRMGNPQPRHHGISSGRRRRREVAGSEKSSTDIGAIDEKVKWSREHRIQVSTYRSL